eukprot:364655-Pleurochrysis_carterae.AAC.1
MSQSVTPPAQRLPPWRENCIRPAPAAAAAASEAAVACAGRARWSWRRCPPASPQACAPKTPEGTKRQAQPNICRWRGSDGSCKASWSRLFCA